MRGRSAELRNTVAGMSRMVESQQRKRTTLKDTIRIVFPLREDMMIGIKSKESHGEFSLVLRNSVVSGRPRHPDWRIFEDLFEGPR